MIDGFQIYFLIFVGIVAWFSYKHGYDDGEYDGIKQLSDALTESGIVTTEVEELIKKEDE